MAYFDCTIGSAGEFSIPLVVTCTANFAGQTITCSDGITTLTETCPSASPYEVTFELPNTGTWTVSGTISGQTYSDSILVNEFDAELVDIIGIIVDVYSAANDTISYVGIDSQTHTITTDSNGHASATITINGNGSSLTFTSSVAKDPSNLSNDYTKTISLNSSTTNVYVCPDGALYWYGYKKQSMTAKANSNNANRDPVAPTVTYNTNHIHIVEPYPSASNTVNMGALISDDTYDYSQYETLNALAFNCVKGSTSLYPYLASSLTDSTQYTIIGAELMNNETSTPQKFTSTLITTTGNIQYPLIAPLATSAHHGQCDVSAIWLE